MKRTETVCGRRMAAKGWDRAGALCGLGVALCLGAAAQGQQGKRSIVYTTDGAGAHKADVYEPAGTGPFPAIVYIHGGSWRSGNKGGFRRLAEDLAAKGYAGFSIDYDLKPHSWPLSYAEALAAVRFVREHAAEYRVNPREIVVMGTSAGGELASLVALAPEGPRGGAGSEKSPAGVMAAVILNGVFDLRSDAHVVTRYLGGTCEQILEVCREASPDQHVHAGAPPFFIGHGTADRTVPYAEAQAFAAQLRQSGVPVTTYDAAGGPHMYWEKKKYYAADLAAIEEFLRGVVEGSAGAR